MVLIKEGKSSNIHTLYIPFACVSNHIFVNHWGYFGCGNRQPVFNWAGFYLVQFKRHNHPLPNGRRNQMLGLRKRMASIFYWGNVYLGSCNWDWMSQILSEVQRRISASIYGRPEFGWNDSSCWSYLRRVLEPCSWTRIISLLGYGSF